MKTSHLLDLHIASFYILSFFTAGLTGLFCPCVLFGRNLQSLREDTHWTRPCICHAIFVEGGISLGIANVAAAFLIPGINPWISCAICEGLYFIWILRDFNSKTFKISMYYMDL